MAVILLLSTVQSLGSGGFYLYRIPPMAIDSIGFQQPEIIFACNFYDLSRENCPYKNVADGNRAVRVDGMTENGKTRSRVAGLIKEKKHERKCDYTLRFYKSAN